MHHPVQKGPKQYVRAEPSEKPVGQQTLPADEILLPVRAGLEQQHTPHTEHGQHVKQKTDDSSQAEDT